MRILIVGTSHPPEGRGGTDIHQHQLARALSARGHEVAVFCRGGAPGTPLFAVTRSDYEGIPIARVAYDFSDVKGFPDLIANPRWDQVLGEELDRFRPDLVHVHHLTGLSTSMLDCVKQRGLPLVMTIHDFWLVCPRGQRITPELELCQDLDRNRCAPCLKRLWPHFDLSPELLRGVDAAIVSRLRKADLLITPSAIHRGRMLEIDLDPSRVRVIEHGLDTALIPPRLESRFPPKRIGFIGSVLPTKGVHVLIEAMNRLGDPALETHVFGEALNFHGDTGYLDRLKAMARKDLPFHFHGGYDQAALPEILRSLDVVVVPSLWFESFCLTIREAMLAGVPVLATDLGAMHEALFDVMPELLFRRGDPEDLGHRIWALCHDEALYRKASSLRARVRDLDAMAGETERAYREIAGYPEKKAEARRALLARKRKGAEKPYATVFVPTWNAGKLFERILDRILAQQTDFDYEVLIIDSGSKDGTVPYVKSKPGVRLIEIPNHEFNHGLTRNRAVEEARGEIVVLLTHDAEPIDEHWLQTLVDNYDDPDVAGAYCHQLPREDCNPFQRDRLKGWTKGEGAPQKRRLVDRERWNAMHPYERYLLIAFDDVASSVRKSVMQEIPFEKRQFGEDVAWGRAAILSGHTIVMDPRSVVIHSHNKPIFYEFKRVYLDHQNLNDLVGLHSVPTFRHVLAFTVKATAHLWSVVRRDDRGVLYRLGWMIKTPWYAFTQNLAQYLGARSNLKGRQGWMGKLDRWLRRGV